MKKVICVITAVLFILLLVSCGAAKKTDYLVLVNKENKLPDDWEKNLVTVTVKNSLGNDVEVEKEAYDHYLELKKALESEGVYVDLDNARRSVSEQQEIWDDFMVEYGEVYTKRYVAVPG